MDLIARKKRILMAQDGFIPPTYQIVDYFELPGRNARIDTGVAGNDNTLKFDFTYMPLTQRNYLGHFGNYVDENTKCWRVIQASDSTPRYYAIGSNIRKAGSSTGVVAVSATRGTIIGSKTHFQLSYGRVSVESDDGYSSTLTQSDDGTTAVSSQNIAIGSISTTGYGLSSYIARFYGAIKIWRGGTLIRNYIPVVRKFDSKAGFYDTVNCTFNPSIGSAEFVAGNE